ncbi:hypothetical protein Metho_2070 [Methanomethylovorans hollandica DSM 15978]|jgi:hypothetical protein|uniref:Uncharacterized protein n=1 Tax=Methanomethylovorans hollandica (strain DSM 15978 / NBRC 107637 / DMS1) TaxID=867904 RepID=L0KYQ1_METHD|nr:hypothetical protein [Methanomethylovorans hollandica]AGB50236.1 hypothetical protein Metho_2070 [Methanomethylovorans hollandica DSM 15978]
MNKKTLEVLLSIFSVLVLIALIIVTHSTFSSNPDPLMESYGFIASLVIFILLISGIGIKLMDVE